jgi:hypothetical protein
MDAAPVTVNNGLRVSPEENRSVWLALAMPVGDLARAHRGGRTLQEGLDVPAVQAPSSGRTLCATPMGARAKERATPAEPRPLGPACRHVVGGQAMPG